MTDLLYESEAGEVIDKYIGFQETMSYTATKPDSYAAEFIINDKHISGSKVTGACAMKQYIRRLKVSKNQQGESNNMHKDYQNWQSCDSRG